MGKALVAGPLKKTFLQLPLLRGGQMGRFLPHEFNLKIAKEKFNQRGGVEK